MSEEKGYEKKLWRKFKQGDRHSFSQIYHDYYSDLYRYGYKILNDSDQTRDCIQNFFLYLWEKRENLGELDTIQYYLIKSFRRHVFKFIEREKRLEEFSIISTIQNPNIVFSREEIIIQKENNEALCNYVVDLLNNLSPRQREIIYLKYYVGLEYKQIAHILSINYQSVLNSLQRAFKKILQTTAPPMSVLILFTIFFNF